MILTRSPWRVHGTRHMRQTCIPNEFCVSDNPEPRNNLWQALIQIFLKSSNILITCASETNYICGGPTDVNIVNIPCHVKTVHQKHITLLVQYIKVTIPLSVQYIKNTTPYLYWCDGSFLGCSNSFLHGTHVGGQGWLVTYSWGDTTQQGRHLQLDIPVINILLHSSS